MDNLIKNLQLKIVDVLNLEDVDPATIDPDGSLIGEVLDIDSIDVLELVIMAEKEYGVVINNKTLGKEIFSTLRTFAEYIHAHSDRALP